MVHPSTYDPQTEICWALIDDALHNISDFAVVPPPQRPRAICPLCKESVTLRLGPKNRHHFAHRSPSSCKASHHETALHLNAKFLIAGVLRNLAQDQCVLWVKQICGGQCGKTRLEKWAEGWDAVEVEYTIHPIRPDIVLLKSGMVIAVIEVFVSHAVDPQKAERFAAQGIRWIEVGAHDLSDWQGNKPLPHLHLHPGLERWICNECLERDAYLREERLERDAILREKIKEKMDELKEKRLAEESAKVEGQGNAGGNIELNQGSIRDRIGICLECGTKTNDWWYFDGATGMCRCHSCDHKARSARLNGKQ